MEGMIEVRGQEAVDAALSALKEGGGCVSVFGNEYVVTQVLVKHSGLASQVITADVRMLCMSHHPKYEFFNSSHVSAL